MEKFIETNHKEFKEFQEQIFNELDTQHNIKLSQIKNEIQDLKSMLSTLGIKQEELADDLHTSVVTIKQSKKNIFSFGFMKSSKKETSRQSMPYDTK